MCLFNSPFDLESKVQVAKQDIVCYKFVTQYKGQLYSLPQAYPYELDKLIVVDEIVWNNYKGYNGLHSLKWENDCFLTANIALECIIPKGTKYFDGEDSYLSYQLLPLRVLTVRKPFPGNCDIMIDVFKRIAKQQK